MLDPFSQRFSDVLFAKYPDWRDWTEPNESSESTLLVTVPAPNSRIKSGLYIETSDEEVTIGTDWFHTHLHGSEPDAFDQAMKLIDGILRDELVVLVYFKGDAWAGSRCVGMRDPWPTPGPGERRLTLSWSGKLDAEMIG